MRFAGRKKSFFASAAGLLAALLLAGCLETGPRPTSNKDAAAKPQLAARPGVSPAGASIAFVSLAGAPDHVRKKLGDAMTTALARRNVQLAEAAKAHYLVQGHVVSFAADRSTQVSFVWDIFGADKRRRHRIEDNVSVKSVAGDPWSLADDKVIAEIARRSADHITAYLTHTPEAIAASKAAGSKGSGSNPRRPEKPDNAASAIATRSSPRHKVASPALSFAPAR